MRDLEPDQAVQRGDAQAAAVHFGDATGDEAMIVIRQLIGKEV